MVKAGIFGISGYAGQKLVEILKNHPEVEIIFGFVSPEEESIHISEIIPKVKGEIDFVCENEVKWEKVEKADIIFLALPHSVSMKFVPEILKRKKKVIDLSADFRFKDLKVYEKWYTKHSCPEFIKYAVYGLPEINRNKIKDSFLVANPGCYPTSVILGILPLVKKNLIDEDIIVDSKSGITGAGRKVTSELLFAECNENIRAYKVGAHRHQPEIEEILNTLSGKNFNILFVPHIVPMNQGILSTCYLKLKKEISEDELCSIYKEFYKDEPFVRIMDYGISPSVKNVFDTNYCDIGFKIVDKNKLVVISAIDNLVKGASGQAVQNMNIMSGFCETIPFIK